MKLKQVGSNRTIVTLDNGTQIGFSYQTPVVAVIDGKSYRTEQRFSNTTSKHCTQLLQEIGYGPVELKPQSFFEALV